MSLRVAVQMDPIESVKLAGDSSFALMLSAQARGYKLWHYDVGSLTLDENEPGLKCIIALPRAAPVQRRDDATVETQGTGRAADRGPVEAGAKDGAEVGA